MELGEGLLCLKVRIETMGVVREIESDAFGGRRVFRVGRKSCFFLGKAVVGEGMKKIIGAIFENLRNSTLNSPTRQIVG